MNLVLVVAVKNIKSVVEDNMWVHAIINGIEVHVHEDDIIEIDERGNVLINGEYIGE